jgi:hypothetical protein
MVGPETKTAPVSRPERVIVWVNPINTICEDCAFFNPKQKQSYAFKGSLCPAQNGINQNAVDYEIYSNYSSRCVSEVSATGNSQTITLSENNASLEKIFREVKRQTGYDFWYESKLLKQAKKVDIHVTNGSLEQVWITVFKISY